jgi:hypothetical protein
VFRLILVISAQVPWSVLILAVGAVCRPQVPESALSAEEMFPRAH